MNKFINLHTNTEYSTLDSTIKIDNLIKYAKKENLSHLVITDRNNMFGVPEFLKKTKENGIKPILGLDLDVCDFRLILLARNYKGYQELYEKAKQLPNVNYMGYCPHKELVGKLSEETDDQVKITKPLTIVMAQQGLGLQQYLFTADPDKTFNVQKSSLITMTKTVKQFADAYTQQTSGLVKAPAGMADTLKTK